MAKYVLGSDISDRGTRLRAGKVIDSGLYNVPLLVAAGALFYASSASALARAAILTQRIRGGQSVGLLDVASGVDQVGGYIPASEKPLAVVRVTHAMSPYAATAGQFLVIDTSAGSVEVDLPVLASGQQVQVKHDENTTLATNTVTVRGPTGVSIAEPPPNNGTFAATVVFGGVSNGGAEAQGEDFTWVNAGSGGGYVLQ